MSFAAGSPSSSRSGTPAGRRRYVVLVPDGCADEPLAELGGRTPLEAAHMPNLARLAARAEVGRAAVIPPGLPPGSDVGNMAILGYDPARYHTGRAPIEAAAMGVELADDEVAYRCNLVTVDDTTTPATMRDFSAGHISTEQAEAVVAALDAELGGGRDGIRFHRGVEYRHVCVVPRALADADCTPPHDITDQPVVLPTGAAADRLVALMEASKPIVRRAAAEVGAAATQMWLWGQGARPSLPAFLDAYGLEGRLVTGVDLVRGLGVLTGLDPVDAEGVTALWDTSYEAERDACIASLADRDFFLVHIEATDEAGHAGRADIKVGSLENWDRLVIGPLVTALEAMGPHRILVMPDHATPCALRTHTSDPVPYLVYDSERVQAGGIYTEAATAACPPVPAHTLMRTFVAP
jgi:2,3-bisphosphoglycerate-independent phosphoglycerate mutase